MKNYELCFTRFPWNRPIEEYQDGMATSLMVNWVTVKCAAEQGLPKLIEMLKGMNSFIGTDGWGYEVFIIEKNRSGYGDVIEVAPMVRPRKENTI